MYSRWPIIDFVGLKVYTKGGLKGLWSAEGLGNHVNILAA